MAPVDARTATAIDEGSMSVADMKASSQQNQNGDSYRKGSTAGLLDGERRRSSVAESKIKLNSGHYIPQVALGVYKAPNDSTTEDAVKWAFEAGYRHVDGGEHSSFCLRSVPFTNANTGNLLLLSAARYANEEAVGRAIKDFCEKSGVPRDEIFVTSKLWDADHERAADAIQDSLKKLQLDYMDLYLVHSPGNLGAEARLKAWKDMEDA